MNYINRHNYESFFLLYIDNELSVAEKMAVDEFVQTNPDLQEELVMLLQSILKPDDIVFDDKKSLLRNESISTRVQEKLLLYLDNELTPTERNEMEGLIEADADIKKEWLILEQTKLLAGHAIVFKDKRSLYKKEAGMLFAFPWWRVAVAAVFIGFGVWGGFVYFNKGIKSGDNEIAKTTTANTPPHTVKLTVPQTSAPVVLSTVKVKGIVAAREITKKATRSASVQSPANGAPGRLTGRDIQSIAEREKINNSPNPYFDNVNRIDSNITITANVTPSKKPNIIVNPLNNEIGNTTGRQEPVNSYASTISYIDNSEYKNNRVLYMDEEKIKKSKLGGIFRKVKRVLERSANNKNGGNNIKVANLEFAIQ